MNRLFTIWSTLMTALVLSGCANTIKMPFNGDEKQAPSSKPIFLMSVTVWNACRERFQPSLDEVEIVRDDSAVKKNVIRFKMDSEGTHEFEDDRQPPRYLVRLALDPGPYVLLGMTGSGRAFPIAFKTYLPLQMPLNAQETGVYYVGSIKATIRPRQGDEFRAGPLIPLIDQAVACAATGTFEVDISDNFDEDMKMFSQSFAPLTASNVRKSLLPSFDRAKVQKWWEQN